MEGAQSTIKYVPYIYCHTYLCNNNFSFFLIVCMSLALIRKTPICDSFIVTLLHFQYYLYLATDSKEYFR